MKKRLVSLSILFLLNCIQAKETCKNGYAGDDNESFASGANDIIVVRQSDGSLLSTNVTVQVELLKIVNRKSAAAKQRAKQILLLD